MPSPIGHALAGAAVAWGGDALDRRRSPVRLVATCVALAAAPDLDLLLPRSHRTYSHSLIAVLLVLIIAAGVTGRVTRLRAARSGGLAHDRAAPSDGQTRWRTAWLCCAAYASHLVLDWLGADTLPPAGLQVLWPFAPHFFISGLNVFAEVERRHPFASATIVQNLWAAAQEVAIVAPVALALWAVRVKTLPRFAPELTGGDHPPQQRARPILRVADAVVEDVENR